MVKLIVHIGHGKTGSSSIQATLEAGRQSLREAGVAYLGLMLEHGAAQGRLPWQVGSGSEIFFAPGRDPAVANEELFDVLSRTLADLDRTGITRAIWSNEWLATRGHFVVPALLRSAALGHQVEVQCYIRRHDSWLVSAYAQWGVKHKMQEGAVLPFEQWRQVNENGRAAFAADLAAWNDAFDRSLRLFNFDAIEDVTRHFLSENDLPAVPPLQANISPPPVELAARAVFNSCSEGEVRPETYRRVARLLETQPERSLPELDQMCPTTTQLAGIVAERAEDIAAVNAMLIRNGQPGLDFTTPLPAITHPSHWEVDQLALRLLFALNDEVIDLRERVDGGPAAAPDPAPHGFADAESALQRAQAEIAVLTRQLAASEQQRAAATMQLRKLNAPRVRAAQERLRLAIDLGNPKAMLSAEEIMAEVARLRADAATARAARDEAQAEAATARALRDEAQAEARQREAELMSSTSWRVTAPLRAFGRLLRRRPGR